MFLSYQIDNWVAPSLDVPNQTKILDMSPGTETFLKALMLPQLTAIYLSTL